MRTYIKKCLHGNFLLLNGDMISEYVNLYGEWCESEVLLYSFLLKKNSNVVEVGSNIGMHTVPLAQICSEGTVFSYEPQRIIFQILNANIAINNLINVNAQCFGIGAKNKTLAIQGTDYEKAWNYGSFSIASGFSSEGDFTGSVIVEDVIIKPLDEIPEISSIANLDLLKVDA